MLQVGWAHHAIQTETWGAVGGGNRDVLWEAEPQASLLTQAWWGYKHTRTQPPGNTL